MTQEKNKGRLRISLILCLLVAVIVCCVAVPTYGIIRDSGTGEAVFVLGTPPFDANAGRSIPGLLERLHDFLFPPEEIPVPVGRRIDLKGRVIYTDGTPYTDGIIRLESEPRFTRSDSDGYFIFRDIEDGEHTISVLDEEGNVLTSCHIDIRLAMEAKDAEMIRLPDGTYLFQVSVNVAVLEITLSLMKDADELHEDVKAVSFSSADMLDVYDAVTYYVSGKPVKVNIFGSNKLIAPGMRGSYQFTVDNTINDYYTRYDLTFTAADTHPDNVKIPMRYRLKADGEYVAGDESAWCDLEQLYRDTTLAGGSRVIYTLEWHWPESANDNKFASYGGDPNFSYTLTIRITAQRQ